MGRATKQNFNGKMGIIANQNRNGVEEPWKSPARTMGYSTASNKTYPITKEKKRLEEEQVPSGYLTVRHGTSPCY
jgi:hypothetical protein